MRCFPNTPIAAPGGPIEISAFMRYLVATPQALYLRLRKAGEQCFLGSVALFAQGKWPAVVEGEANDLAGKALLSTGAALGITVGMREAAAYKGCAVHSLHLWGMRCKSAQTAKVKALNEITTLEDHLLDGGFGSWMTEALADKTTATGVLARTLSAEICRLVTTQPTLNELGCLTRKEPT